MKNVSTEIKNKTVNTLNVTTMKTKIHIMAVCLLSVVMVISCSKYEDDLVAVSYTHLDVYKRQLLVYLSKLSQHPHFHNLTYL